MGKCKFWQDCKLFNKHSVSCVENGGMYSFDGYGDTPAACYRRREDTKKQTSSRTYQKE